MTARDDLIERVERSLDDENHEQLCHCSEWPNDCVTYGKRRPWSYSHVGAIDAVLAAGYVKMPSREALRGALSNVLCNAMNYPPAVRTRVLGQDMTPLLDGTADAIVALLAGETS